MRSNGCARPPRNEAAASLADVVRRCRGDGAFLSALRGVYVEVDRAVARRQPTCRACGECCRFERSPHRLYVSTGELALLVGGAPPEPSSRAPASATPSPPGGKAGDASRRGRPVPVGRSPIPAARCAYQIGARCTARAARPLGCRVYFCEAGLSAWSQPLYERFHRRIQQLHRRHGHAYRYVELTAALAELSAVFALTAATP